MDFFNGNIEKETLENTDFRRVIFTGKHTQLVLMSLLPGEEIGLETHDNVDQFFRFEKGTGKVIIDGGGILVEADDAVIVPAGCEHNIVNTGSEDLKLYTLYSPPNHPDGTVHITKKEAEASEHH